MIRWIFMMTIFMISMMTTMMMTRKRWWGALPDLCLEKEVAPTFRPFLPDLTSIHDLPNSTLSYLILPTYMILPNSTLSHLILPTYMILPNSTLSSLILPTYMIVIFSMSWSVSYMILPTYIIDILPMWWSVSYQHSWSYLILLYLTNIYDASTSLLILLNHTWSSQHTQWSFSHYLTKCEDGYPAWSLPTYINHFKILKIILI